MAKVFKKQMREFAFSRMDEVYKKQVLVDERHHNADRAKAAFWHFVKSKVTPELYEELLSAYVTAEPIINDRASFSDFALYWQGYQDGLRAAYSGAKELYEADPEVERTNFQRHREALQQLERATSAGADVSG